MFSKLLIANRGEIACRIIKTARAMGIKTVAVYSDADKHALHVKLADEAVHIGASPSRDSYLCGERVIAAAKKTGAEAIHPGYGFLSENAEFCRQCEEHNLVFVGPPIAAIEAMGSKSAAKTIMAAAQVPLVPGYHGNDQNPDLLKQSATAMGYPVLLKAVAGGGGKGMRQVWSEAEFDGALASAKREAKASFNNDDMLVEKYLTQPRHVEVQVFCDQQGNGVYLFERDCSIQRRHQKVIEEAPAPNLPAGVREKIGETALRAAQAIQYQGAGTVEFLLDADGAFYFMEMNTRLQVEHPVTEMITGQDLVEWQLRVAAGEPLPLQQHQLSIRGHAFEARIYAEDPNNDFLPETGVVHFLRPPQQSRYVRVDTGIVQGDEVSVFYDPMIAKLIVWGENRERALARLASALSDYRIGGVVTNIGFLQKIATSDTFARGEFDTGFIARNEALLFSSPVFDAHKYMPLAALYLLLAGHRPAAGCDPRSPWSSADNWRLNEPGLVTLPISILGHSNGDGEPDVQAVIAQELGSEGRQRNFRMLFNGVTTLVGGEVDGDCLCCEIDGHRQKFDVVCNSDSFGLFTEEGLFSFKLAEPDYGDAVTSAKAGFKAPMNGTIIAVLAKPSAALKAGDVIMIMEAMKMEHTIRAPVDGVLRELYFVEGDLVEGGAELLFFEAFDNG